MAAAKKTAAKKTSKSAVTKKPTATKTAVKETKPRVKVNLHNALQEYFGFNKFKGTQEKAIESLLAGHDTFVIMPTGGGKVFATNCRH